MLVAAAVCPHPPLLIPGVAAGAGSELDELRAACGRALDELLGAAPEMLVVVGVGEETRVHPAGSVGSMEGYGLPSRFVLGETAEPAGDERCTGDRTADERAAASGGPASGGTKTPASLPLSLTAGAWLLGTSGWTGPVLGQEVSATATPEECRLLGETLAIEADRVGLLVMGDGSARRVNGAPGGFDPAAADFDARVARALFEGDAAALLDLDPVEAERLWVAGRAAWQVLAGAAGDEEVDSELLYDAAPYGVGYLVAVWEWHG